MFDQLVTSSLSNAKTKWLDLALIEIMVLYYSNGVEKGKKRFKNDLNIYEYQKELFSIMVCLFSCCKLIP